MSRSESDRRFEGLSFMQHFDVTIWRQLRTVVPQGFGNGRFWHKGSRPHSATTVGNLPNLAFSLRHNHHRQNRPSTRGKAQRTRKLGIHAKHFTLWTGATHLTGTPPPPQRACKAIKALNLGGFSVNQFMQLYIRVTGDRFCNPYLC